MSEEPDYLVDLRFHAEVIYWRGPAPFFFIPVPMVDADMLRDAARSVSYGWGMVPVEASIADIPFETALFPKNGGYYLPLKAAVRRRIDVSEGDGVVVELKVRASRQ